MPVCACLCKLTKKLCDAVNVVIHFNQKGFHVQLLVLHIHTHTLEVYVPSNPYLYVRLRLWYAKCRIAVTDRHPPLPPSSHLDFNLAYKRACVCIWYTTLITTITIITTAATACQNGLKLETEFEQGHAIFYVSLSLCVRHLRSKTNNTSPRLQQGSPK